jgi:hypothetical protein
MWAAYFPRGELHGVDIEESARAYAGERIEIQIGDAGREDVLKPILAKAGGRFEVIIDDGSHRYDVHQSEHGRPPVLEGLAAVYFHHQLCLLEKSA